MRARLIELRERRAQLLERAARDRAGLGEWLERAEVVEGWMAKGAAAAGWLRRRPLLVAAGVAMLIALRPRRALPWLAKGVALWRAWREARALWQQLAPLAGGTRRAP
jgi:hypothetical protein